MQVVIGILIGLIAGGLGSAIAVGALGKSRLGAAQQQRKQLIEDAEREADTPEARGTDRRRARQPCGSAPIEEEVAEEPGRGRQGRGARPSEGGGARRQAEESSRASRASPTARCI